jgi:hypothetical protein
LKTFGIKSLYLLIITLAALVISYIIMGEGSSLRIAFGIPSALMLGQLLYAPVIRISDKSLSIFTLFPFNKNINIQLSDVTSISIEVNNTMRFVVYMKDGSVVSTTCNRYAYNMKPMYTALRDTDVRIETHGVGAIDWV